MPKPFLMPENGKNFPLLASADRFPDEPIGSDPKHGIGRTPSNERRQKQNCARDTKPQIAVEQKNQCHHQYASDDPHHTIDASNINLHNNPHK
jgi:hypothetical protein